MPQQSWKRYFASTPAIVAWVVTILILIAIYFVIANQITPYTSRAVVYARVISLSPEVSGHITQSFTTLKRQYVEKGKVLFVIDPKPYAYKLAIAKNELEITKENVANLSLQVENMQKGIAAKKAAFIKVKQDYERYLKLYQDNVISVQTLQHSYDDMQIRQADLDQSIIELKAAEQNLGKFVGGINVHVRLAQAQLKLANFYYQKTSMRAPTDGYVENLYLHKGAYVEPGETKIPFILARTWWIESLVRENGLSNIEMGRPALVVLDLYPGHVFHGTVTSVGHGVEVAAIKPSGFLPEYNSDSTWFQSQQLFPFGVKLDPSELKPLTLRVGSSADVVVLKSHMSAWNGVAYFVMWLKSLWAYL